MENDQAKKSKRGGPRVAGEGKTLGRPKFRKELMLKVTLRLPASAVALLDNLTVQRNATRKPGELELTLGDYVAELIDAETRRSILSQPPPTRPA